MTDFTGYLESRIGDSATLPELVDAFEKMCQLPLENKDAEELLLFETGTFTFSQKRHFYFSLVRQFSNEEDEDEDEYIQVRMDVKYRPEEKTKPFHGAIWSDELEGDFFAFVRNSPAFSAVKDDQIAGIYINVDET